MKPFIRSALIVSALGVALAATALAAGPETFKVSEFTFKRPAQWEWIESTSSMRAAQLKVADAEKKQVAEVIFFYFGPGGAGGTRANVDRWLAQFSEPREKLNPRIDEVTVGQTKVTYVQAEGTYQSGVPGGPKTPLPNHTLLGAIVEGGQGSVFVRMTGPTALVNAASAAFKQMIESALK